VNTRSTIYIALAAVVIFAAGVTTGGLLVFKTSPRPTPTAAPGSGVPFVGRVDAMGRTVNQLDLSPSQRRRIQEILRNGRERMADYFMILEPDIQQVFREMRHQIQTELTAAQRAEFDELLRRRQQQRGAERHPEPPANPGNTPAPPAGDAE
jgi:Spy/CpxP family protein refolding chaperone